MGIEHSTFLIDGKEILRQELHKAKVESHVDEILDAINTQ